MDDVTGVQTDSPPVTETPTEPTAQAPSQPANGNGQGQPQARTIPLDSHLTERRAWHREREQLRQELESLKRPASAPSVDQPLSPQEEVEMRQAAAALKRILGVDGDLKSLLDLAKNGKSLLESHQNVQQLAQQQYRGVLTAGDDRVASLAKAAGLPDTPEFTSRTQNMVAAVISLYPEAVQALRQGDLTVVDKAFDVVKGYVEPLRRQQTAGVAATKIATANLPPNTNGGLPGEPISPVAELLKQGKDREARSNMHSRAASVGMANQG